MKKSLLETLKEKPLLGDGAMGTQLMFAGLEQGNCGEAWNINEPDRVVAIQRRYVKAGSDCLITNTFGGCCITLARHNEAEHTDAINRASVEIARKAFGEKEGFVLGGVGPFGGIMEPYGEVEADVVEAALRQQVNALVGAGADAIIIETQTSFEELEIGIAACQEAGAPCIIGSLAYDVTQDGSTFRTMMGIDPERAAEFMLDKGVHILALNCGTGMDMARALTAAKRYKAVAGDVPVMTQPNAGLPELENRKVVYKETPEEMARGVAELLDAGVRIVGGCCGTTPDHLRAFRQVLDDTISKELKHAEDL
jgi:5-methyltetrahydrofolate--homocysteine methyltransferase